MNTSRWHSHGRAAALALVVLGSCFAEPNPAADAPGAALGGDAGEGSGGRQQGGQGGQEQGAEGGDLQFGGLPDGPGGSGGEGSVCPPARPLEEGATCRSAETAEPLPMSLVVSLESTATDSTMFTADLFGLFKSSCGRCHVENTLTFHASLTTFSRDVEPSILDIITSDDPDMFMPPPGSGGRKFSERPAGDPVRRLADLLAVWIQQGKPESTFVLPAGQGGMSPYRIPRETAAAFTNLGTCIPDAGMVGTEFDKMCSLDVFFEGLEKKPPGQGSLAERVGLPERLDQTDLFTFDTQALARTGVVAFAPTYPLWSDDAGKIRMVRVPLGQQIRYDEETGEFDIPPNTRFYKTFLKAVKEADGVTRHRKVETRLIVARPAKELPDGTFEQQALYGSYLWNPAESEATLITVPLGSQEPFADVLLTLVTDEPGAAVVREQDKDKQYRLVSDMEDAGVLRRYAIPGSTRCVQCHMGSSSESFVLGFSPLQLNRRPDGDGGVISPTGRDELTQLERLIEYGIVGGLSRAKDAPKLETSQLPREPRTPYELTAQSYMVGNCGHCHAPNGYPSVTNPALKPLLNFWPSKAGGGIFEFPLDRMSPRIKRGKAQDIEVPYITPSLRDLWPPNPDTAREIGVWRPKGLPPNFIDAPWRSAIYRNVDTPYTYSDDYGIFPHMPMNTPGFDCRAPRILAEWMTSIPAKRKNPTINEDAVPIETLEAAWDSSPQPYLEVKKPDTGYLNAVVAGERRVEEYRAGSRHAFCPDTRDIQDRNVLEGELVTPVDDELGLPPHSFPVEGVPDRPHWSTLDLTDTAGNWYPRRGDWYKVLIEHDFGEPPDPGVLLTNPQLGVDYTGQEEVVGFLSNIKLSELDEFKAFALGKIPFGIWRQKDGCNFGSVPKVGDFSADARPHWMEELATPSPAKEELPVYMTPPGAAIYGMICINCHGAQADSNGRQASTLSDMTGGAARVANFKTGLFGTGGANIARVFGEEIVEHYQEEMPDGGKPPGWTDAWPQAPEDWAARYMAWMALGGTKQRIPPAVTNLVAGTEVLGIQRNPPLGAGQVSANMLAVAQTICFATLPLPGIKPPHPGVERGSFSRADLYDATGLILSNGDAELWDKICYWDNPGPIVALRRNNGSWVGGNAEQVVHSLGFYSPAAYPPNTPIGDQFGNVTDTGPAGEISPDNHFRWCVPIPEDPVEEAAARLVTINGKPLPFCPSSLLVEENRWKNYKDYQALPDGMGTLDFRDDFRRWGERAAINAGLAVFLYLRDILVNGAQPELRYDECERISAE